MANTSQKSQEKFAKTKAELCRILDVARSTLDAWLELPEHPRCTSDGRYVVAEWRVFAANRRIDSDAEEAAGLKLQKLRDEVSRGQLELMKAAGEVVPLEWSRRIVAHVAISVRTIVQSADISAEAKEAITAKIEAIDVEEFLRRLAAEAGATE